MSEDPTTQPEGPTAPPTLISYSRALYGRAVDVKHSYWYLEVIAAASAVLAAYVQPDWAAGLAGVLGVLCKVLSKSKVSTARSWFRAGERARRYDFYSKTLGWPIPPRETADLSITHSDRSVRELAGKLADKDADYYAYKGPPCTERLLSNLAESMFWSERLMEEMAKRRGSQVVIAIAAVIAVLAGALLGRVGDAGLVVVKMLGLAIAVLVAIDVYGEARSFSRGEKAVGRLLGSIVNEMDAGRRSRDEGLRFLIEYNCLMADLPLIPDGVYESKKTVLDEAWVAFQKSLPIQPPAT